MLASGDIPEEYPSKSTAFLYDENRVGAWHEIFKRYIRLNKKTEEYVDASYKRIFPSDSKVLGVLARGTDYTALKPYKHPVQPEPIEIIDKSRELMREHNCEYISGDGRYKNIQSI